MDEKSEGGRKNGGGNDTDDTKEEETIRAVDNRDTENGVDQNVDDGIKTEDPEVLPRRETTSEQPYETLPPGNDNAPPTEESEFQENARRVETKAEVKGPIGEALGKTDQTKASNSEEQSDPDSSQAKPGKENTSEEPSKKVQSESDSAQPTVESQLLENASDVETKAGEEVKEPYDEAQNATEDKNIAQVKADQTNASNSEEQSDPDSSQAKPGKENTTEEPSKKVQSDNDSAQPTVVSQLLENASDVETKAEVKEPYDEAQNATEDKNIAQGKANQTNASNSEEQSDPDSSQADSGTDQVETSRTVQDQDGGPPQTDADSPSELAGNKGGIPDSNLEKLTKSLMVDKYSARSLGQTLGFIPTEVYRYCGYGKPKDSIRILRMLRAWKYRTPDAKQISGLLEALKKANLKHLAGDLRSQEGAEEQREASDGDSVTSPSKSVQPTTTRSDPLTDNPKSSPSVVPEAGPGTDTKGAPGNYSGQTDKEEKGDLQKNDSSSKPKGTSSKKESVAGPGTDTKGAPGNNPGQTDRETKGDLQKTDSSSKPKGTNSKKVESVAGPGTDTKGAPGNYSGQTDKEEKGDPQKTDSSSKPKDTKPPKVPCSPPPNPTTPNSGSKDPKDEEGARERKTKELSEEEKRATENKANELKLSKEGAAAAGNGTKEDGTTNQKADNERVKEDDTNLPAEPLEHIIKERPVSISVCTSAYDYNVQGLVSFLKDLMDVHQGLIKEVKVHALPYNDLDHYKFPKEKPVDVMLLCHSINNRRFAITDVMDALYDEYLPYCARVVGKNKMGVIVHDFDDMNEAVQSSRMGSFSYKQPKAFETTTLQIICGQIEKKKQVLKQMQKVDRAKVLEFLKNASTFPEEMIEERNADPSLFKVAKKYVKTKASSSYSSFKEMITPAGWRQDSTSERSSVDPSEAYGNDHGTIHSATAQDDESKRPANERHSSSQPAKRACLSNEGASGGSHQTPKGNMDERNLNLQREASLIEQQRPGTYIAMATAHTQCSPRQQTITYSSGGNVTSASQRSHTTPSPRRISVSVCSSAYEHNVKGFMSKLTKLQAGQPPLIADVRFRALPYNDIDSFKFPSYDPVDVMVLCHSTQNRGFSITNVLNALYEKYLQYCHDVIGKKKLAVIVHDFSDCKPKTLDVKMESFRRSQPLTFQLADTVIVCGSLEKPGNIEIRDEDMTRLTMFFERARFEPKENYADEKSVMKSVRGFFNI